ncbi:multidrug effflux MFS transporter [Ralstonia nicotianae]|uniref:multidrug effflux MFS transporter n=1 Tax=Ralstonia pseudosolanacearum TaxID=1310165 RepID=UPI002003B2A6|nr:multidrug effflux MFS transporter [Ralstonia pseudosolanacearum]MCK4120518.1 multidrug effflux MFS transporter [Ralstonia pseudosolanacearum]
MHVRARLSGALYPRWLILVGLVTALGPISTDMYLPGFPAISAEFGASQSLVQYTVTAFLAGLAIGQLLYGPLSDRIGRKLPLCVGIVLYAVASIGCGLAEDISALISWRFVQGAGGCAGIVIGRAMVRDRFGSVASAKAFSLMMLIVAVAPMIAPLIGGWITGFGWRPIFAVLALFGAFLVTGVLNSIDETLPAERRTHKDASTIVGQYRALLSSTQLLSYTAVAGFMQSALYAYVISAPFVLMEVYGIRPQYFGLVFFANTAGLIVASQINAAIVGRFNPDRILGIALLWPVGLSMTLIVSQLLGFSSIYLVLTVLFGLLTGHGFISPNATALGLSKHGTQAGTASAVMGAIQFGLGIATISATSLFKATSALPLAVVMGVCSCLALACHRLVARPALRQS